MKQIKINNRRYRVIKKTDIWIGHSFFFFPEVRYKWFPFWFKLLTTEDEQVFFDNEEEAWNYINLVERIWLTRKITSIN